MTEMKKILAGLLVILLSGCASMVVDSVVAPAVDNLQKQTDLELVCEGAPAFLLMIDSLLADDPDRERLLVIAARAYSSYASVLTACDRNSRAVAVSEKARDYGLAVLAKHGLAGVDTLPLDQLSSELAGFSRGDAAALFWGGYGWVSWLQNQEGSPASLADLLKVELIMLKVVELDEACFNGAAHLFLGAYYGARSRMLGGNPEESLSHFDRALALSNRHFLPVQVAFAETYARTVFDRDLYEKLLVEVIDFPLQSRPELSLANQAAKHRARQLLADIDLYF